MGINNKAIKSVHSGKNRKLFEKKTTAVQKNTGNPTPPDQTKSIFSPGTKTALFILAPFLLFFMFHFYPFAFNNEQFCFRDIGYSFYPMFLQGQESIQSGELPYWDCYENLGMPFLGNPVTGIFYPPQLIFLLTFFFPGSYGFIFKWFILLHFPIAYWGIFRLARRWKMSLTASVLSAAVYTFSTPYFFQYCNVIMFIGGTWLPWAIHAGDRVLRDPRRTGPMISLAIILAITVFGGDPEAAYFAGFFLIGLWLVYRRFDLLSKEISEGITNKFNSLKPLFRIACSALLGIFLSAAVVLPAGEYARLSSRGQQSSPYSIWEIPGFLKKSNTSKSNLTDPVYSPKSTVDNSLANGLFCLDLRNDPQMKNRYDASLAPWDLLELLWPNLTGNHFHGFCWSGFWPNDTMWIPTLYMGAIPLLFVLSVFTLRRKRKMAYTQNVTNFEDQSGNLKKDNRMDPAMPASFSIDHNNGRLFNALILWGSWGVILSILAALGGFGLGWFIRALSGAENLTFDKGDPVGGVYWICNIILPKFASFRYPAKFTMMTALFFAFLAGLGWETLKNHLKKINRISIVLLALTGLTAFVFFITGIEPLANIPRESPSVNPQIFRQSLIYTFFSLTQTGLGLFLFLLLLFLKRKNRISSEIFALILLITATVDLVYTNADFIPKRMEADYAAISPLAETMMQDHKKNTTDDLSLPLKFYMPRNWTPLSLLRLDSLNRMSIINSWEQSILTSRHPYRLHIGQFQNIYPTAVSAGVYQVQNGLDELIFNSKDPELRQGISAVLAALDIDYIVCSASDPSPPGFEMLEGSFAENDSYETKIRKAKELAQKKWPENTIVWKNGKSAPHVKISRARSCSKSIDPLRRLIEDFQPEEPGKLAGESARISRYQANRLTLEVSLKKEGSIILAEQYWPGWNATVHKNDGSGISFNVPVYKEKGLLRRMDLPAGDYIVEMEFKNRSARAGLMISGLTWLVCLLFLLKEYFLRKSAGEKTS